MASSSDGDSEELGSLLHRSRHAHLDDVEEKPPKQRAVASNRSTFCTVIILVLAAIISLAILSQAFSAWSAQFATPSSHESETEPEEGHHEVNRPDEYLLSRNWNFDADAQVREYNWEITDTELNPDGVFRPMVVINNQFPGPLIECNEGDTLVINVHNVASNATSIHWHGIYQNGTNWMDGTAGISQCPIGPGMSFTYRFTVDGQSGTYWYHAHHAMQASDGVVGPLIIHSKTERQQQKIEYATDRVVMVSDHYYDLSGALLLEYLQPGNENDEPVPTHALINGKGIRDCDSLPDRRCDNSTAERPVFDLAPGQNHRLRFINVGAFAEFQVQIDEHEFHVTEADGTDLKPAKFHRLKIQPAQRYSIVVSTDNQRTDSFWMRARMVNACFAEQKTAELEPEVRGIIRYTSSKDKRHGHEHDDDDDDDDHDEDGHETMLGSHGHDTVTLPQSEDWPETVEVSCLDLDLSKLRPVTEIEAPTTADTTLYLRSNFEIGNWRLSRGFFNSSSWRASVTSPSLHRVVDGFSSGNQSFLVPNGTSTFVNDKAFEVERELVHQSFGIKTIDLVISNFDDGAHPFHLHGYKFFVLAQGHGYPPSNWTDTVDLSNPLRRDTATIEAFGWIILRFVADNPGVWPFHCHLSWHSEAGLLMQFITRADLVKDWTLPQTNLDLCHDAGIERGSGPADEIWFGNLG